MKEQPFYIGQKVVSTTNNFPSLAPKDHTFTVTDILFFCCGLWCIGIGIGAITPTTACPTCGVLYESNGVRWFNAAMFAPVQEGFQAITFEKVMEQELASLN